MMYFHRIIDKERKHLAPNNISSAHMAIVEGERITAGLIEKEKGSGSQPHRHPNVEQFNYIIKGKFKSMVEDEHMVMEPGDMVHIPANSLHQMVAVGDGENIYFMAKDSISDPDLRIFGIPDDKNVDKPWYEEGYDPEEK
jgi:quercetin dioxygenase-like cupin family protein